MKKILLTFSILTLAACGQGSVEHNEAAKTIKPGYAVMLENPTYTQNDLDYLENIRQGNIRRVKSLLSEGSVNVYSADENDLTGLALAAQLNNKEAAEAILEHTEQNDTKVLDRGDKSGKTPLHYAAESGAADIIKLLRKKGANPNIYDPEQNFPLLTAAKKNDVDSVYALIYNYGDATPANPDLQDSVSDAAILHAVKHKNRDMVQALKSYGANMNIADAEGTTPLVAALNTNDKEFLEFFFSLGIDVNAINPATQRTALIYVLDKKNYEAARYLLDKGADPNLHTAGLPSPLQVAVSTDNADPGIVDYLIAKGAKLNDPNIPLGNVIVRSIHKGNAPVVSKLIAAGAKASDLESETSSGVIQALNAGDAETAILLINSGADIHKIDTDGYSALALAAKQNMTNVFEILVKKGADVNQTSRNTSAIPIEIVLSNDQAEMLEIMFNNGLKASPDAVLLRAISAKTNNVISVALKHGARPNIMNLSGQPVLWLAIVKDNNEAAKALIEAGALLDVQDKEKGISPLSLAIARGNVEMVNYLLERKANPDLIDSNGFSSLAYAAAYGQAEIVKALIAHNAEVNAVDKNGNTILQLVDLGKSPKDKKEEIKAILKAAGAQ